MHGTAILLLKYNGYHSFYMTISLFLIKAVVLVAAVVTLIVYNVSATNAQSSNMNKTKTLTGPNMTKTANMTAFGGNITKSDLAAYAAKIKL